MSMVNQIIQQGLLCSFKLSFLDSQFQLFCSWLKFIFQLRVVFMCSGYISWEGV
jgi:hypothetical protein